MSSKAKTYVAPNVHGYRGGPHTPAMGYGRQGNDGAWPYPIYPEPGEDRNSPSFLARVAFVEAKRG